MEKIVRTDAELALDEVTESCKAAADHYHSAARIAPDDLSAQFLSLMRQRDAWAHRLENEVRAMGHLPSAPDADREAFDHLITRVKAALSHDERAALLEKSAQVERDLVEKAEAALRQDLSESALSFLREISRGAAAARDRLSAAGG